MNTEKILNTLKSWGYNEGEIEEIVVKLAQDGKIRHANAKVSDDREVIYYELELTDEGVDLYKNWCRENDFTPNLGGKLKNILIFDDQNENSVKNTLLEWGILTNAEQVEIRPDFPNRDEAYAILRGENGRFAFAWGWKFPYADEVPIEDISDGENGLEWFDTEDAARTTMNEAVTAWETERGN